MTVNGANGSNGHQERVTVGIVGGGVGGLALARMLEMAGVSYILFEANELVPRVGASVGILPPGMRILDQIRALDDVEKWKVPHDRWEHRDGTTGKLYRTSKALRALTEFFGYDGYFVERYYILKSIYDSIQDKSRLQGFKKVVNVQTLDDRSIVTAADGTSFSCQIVAGADGVHSVVRKFVRQEVPTPVTPAPDYLTANTYCVFGMSSPLDKVGAGRHFTLYHPKASVIAFTGLNGKIFWFIFKELEAPLPYSERRAWDEKDAQAAYEMCKDLVFTEGVKFSDVWDTTEYKVTLTVEQGICESFYAGRMFLLGDAVHKMTPHGAMGANSALESSACFVNNLLKLRDSTGSGLESISSTDASAVFEAYANQRRERVTGLKNMAGANERIQLRLGKEWEMFEKGLPVMPEHAIAVRILASVSHGEKLENWPVKTERTEKFDRNGQRALEAEKDGTLGELVAKLCADMGLD